jgi:hypothetical protein
MFIVIFILLKYITAPNIFGAQCSGSDFAQVQIICAIADYRSFTIRT